jgi:hypothetical protein
VLTANNVLVKNLESRVWGRPQGLRKVLEEGVAKGELLPLDVYLTQQRSIYASRGWLERVRGLVKVPSLWDVAGWVWRNVGFWGEEEDGLPSAKFVLRENLEVLSHMQFKNREN